ncbi:MAG: hypothetical protein WKG32_22895 [Gemmatimonadaceae bacterium]
MTRSTFALALLALLTLLVTAAPAASAQARTDSTLAATQGDRPRVYVDCQSFFCDFDFFRTEIAFVDYVRDRQVADVHIFITTQQTGGGGTQFAITFIGQRQFAGTTDSLAYTSRQTDSQDVVRRALARVLKLGLVRYVARLPIAERIQISYAVPQQGAGAATTASSARDPWNYWVLRVRGNGNFNGEKTSKFTNLSGSTSANRTTQAWKINLSLNGSYGESRFRLSSGTFTNYTHSYGGNGLVVKSLGDHWSAGVTASANSSTFLNQDASLRVAPAVEYNVFPYAQSTRRQLTLRYALGASSVNYREQTIFNKTVETLYDENLVASLSVRQPWGSVETSVEGGHYLHNLDKYHGSVFTSMDLRLIKGLSLNLFGSVSSIRDQLYLSSRGVTDEEALVRARQRATSYRYSAFVGLGYTFGSIFNNVVNPRFGGSSGGSIIFF